MARQARVVIPGTPHPVTRRGNHRQPTFFDDSDYLACLQRAGEEFRAAEVEVRAYVEARPEPVFADGPPCHPRRSEAEIGDGERCPSIPPGSCVSGYPGDRLGQTAWRPPVPRIADASGGATLTPSRVPDLRFAASGMTRGGLRFAASGMTRGDLRFAESGMTRDGPANTPRQYRSQACERPLPRRVRLL